MSSKLICPEHVMISPEVLIVLKSWEEQNCKAAVYQNHDMGHSLLGHLQFLKIGEGCTFQSPPERMPDTAKFIGWRYVFVGFADELGLLIDVDPVTLLETIKK